MISPFFFVINRFFYKIGFECAQVRGAVSNMTAVINLMSGQGPLHALMSAVVGLCLFFRDADRSPPCVLAPISLLVPDVLSSSPTDTADFYAIYSSLDWY